jgi:DNA-binding MarR family transcriptional regulator
VSCHIIKKTAEKYEVIPTKIFEKPEKLRQALQPLRWKILTELMSKPQYPKAIANKFKVNEQKIYYHIRKLEELGLIKVERTEEKRGAIANYYTADIAALAIAPQYQMQLPLTLPTLLNEKTDKLLRPFVTSEGLNAHIVVGCPDVHGEFKQKARCGHNAVDVALFFGSISPLSRKLVVKLDTEINDKLLRSNLILIGGPRVNMITLRVNENLPIKFEENHSILSTISGKSYNGEEEGVIEIISNPFDNKSKVMVLAGITGLGTRSAVVGLIKHLEEVSKGNSLDAKIQAKVVSGLDLDADGIIDDVEFLE